VGTAPAINAYFDDISLTVASTLPLKLISFKGETNASYNLLQWSTGEEINTRHFIIESPVNSHDWNAIGTTDAAGTTNITSNYTFQDLLPGVLDYYRLKMEDIDGRFTYSPIIKLSRTNEGLLEMKTYPNPVSDILNINTPFAQELELKILNNTGQLIMKKELLPQNNLAINTSKLPPGLYLLILKDKTGRTVIGKFSRF
jgi:Secretion system C-terminal sorting domain